MKIILKYLINFTRINMPKESIVQLARKNDKRSGATKVVGKIVQ